MRLKRGLQIAGHDRRARRVVACAQRPSALACSTSARPGGRISPLAMSASALWRLSFDHTLLALRGVNFCNQQLSSWRRFWPSIQP